MANVRVQTGLSWPIIRAKCERHNGLHILKVHNGVVTHYGRLEKVQEEAWMKEALAASLKPKRKRSGPVKKKKAAAKPQQKPPAPAAE